MAVRMEVAFHVVFLLMSYQRLDPSWMRSNARCEADDMPHTLKMRYQRLLKFLEA